jgi:hypothetical protein
VIFLSRSGSVQPFANHLPTVRCAADLTALIRSGEDDSRSVGLTEGAQQALGALWPLYKQVHMEHRLLTVHFTTLFEYLKYLEVIARCLHVRSSLLRQRHLFVSVTDNVEVWNLHYL